MRQDGIKRASIDKLKSRFETAYYSEDMVITPLVMFRELDDLTALIQGVSIGVTVSGTAKIKINGKLHELRPNTLFTLGNLQDQRSADFLSGLSDALNDLHVVNVESADGVAAVISLLKHLSSSYECHKKLSFFKFFRRNETPAPFQTCVCS